MTTLVPRKPYTDEELRQLYPAGLELQLVQVLMRHGERTQVSPRFQNAGVAPFWPYCAAVKQFRTAVLADAADPGVPAGGAATKPLDTIAWKRRLETFGADDAAVPATGSGGEVDALCDMGMLTDTGRLSTLRLGQRLRALYVDRLGFLPARLGADADADGLFYLRATPIPRALESMQQAFVGLYPEVASAGAGAGAGAEAARAPLTIVSRVPADETLFPNDGNCRRFAALSRAFAQRAADRWNDSPELAHATRHIGPWLPPDSPRVAVDGRPRLSGILDTVNSTLAHGPATRLPPAFYEAQTRRNIEVVALEEWFAGYEESQEYRALGIGGLLGDVTQRMAAWAAAAAGKQQQQRQQAAKFGLSGCHDTTLAAVLSSLGHKMAAWPPFTSHLAIELFRGPADAADAADAASPAAPAASSGWFSSLSSPPDVGRKPTPTLSDREKKTLDGYYVRIRYNDEPVTVPGCQAAGNHLSGNASFCTLAAFKAIVDKFTPRDWKKACRSNIHAAAFPEKPEPAGY